MNFYQVCIILAKITEPILSANPQNDHLKAILTSLSIFFCLNQYILFAQSSTLRPLLCQNRLLLYREDMP